MQSTAPQRHTTRTWKGSAILYIGWLVAAVLLILAPVGRHPYSFYTLLRWICCAVFVYSAFATHERNRALRIWIFGVLAVLFNPIVPVHLQRSTWRVLDWATAAAILIVALFFAGRRARYVIAWCVGLAVFPGVPLLFAFLNRPSSQEEADKAAYFACEDKVLTAWAAQDVANVRERLALVDKYCFGCWDWDDPTKGGKLSEYDVSQLKEIAQLNERTRAASKIGVTEAELITLDKKIIQHCGYYPEYKDKFPFGRTRVK